MNLSTVKKEKSQESKRLSIIMLICVGLALCCLGSRASGAIKKVEDDDITNHLEKEYRLDNSVSSDEIDILTIDGVVTLSGTVDNILAKERAKAIAEATVGVRAIVNDIKVIPPISIDDDEILTGVENALLKDPAADKYEIDVSVSNGIVTLSGEVDSWQEKQLSAFVAKGVKGVLGIKNDIIVNFKTARSDYEIIQEVVRRLANDVRVDDALVNVEVKDGKVILTGAVGSLQEKLIASSDAWVGGVNFVDDVGLEVKWWLRDSMRREKAYISRSDEEIEKSVKDAFLYDPRVLSFEINVDVDQGTVILSGVVDNFSAKKAAAADAKNTIGVNRVINNLKVRPSDILIDEDIQRNIAESFMYDPYINRFEFDIKVYGGLVYLSGNVNTSWEKNRAERLAELVKGVIFVNNNIDYEYSWVWKPDWDIKDDVEDELFWSPFVDEDQVKVSVTNGIVTLNGKVDTYSEYQSAEENAYEGGAKDVINNLKIRHHYYGPYYNGIYSPYHPYGYNYPFWI